MPTPTKGPRLGGSPSHERLMLANLATSLFEHGRITTTETKAKRLRPLAERLITFAKRGDLHARRQVLTVVRDKSVVHTLFAEIGPRYENRPGGYTRIVKVGPRKGDNAPMAVIELVEAVTAQQSVVSEAERSRGTRFARRRGAAGAGTATAAGSAGVATPEVAADSGAVERGAVDSSEIDSGAVDSAEIASGEVVDGSAGNAEVTDVDDAASSPGSAGSGATEMSQEDQEPTP